MYNKFDKYIYEFLSEDSSEDFWYDIGVIRACKILSEFQHEDWVNLSDAILSKPLEWQKKLVYCIDSGGSVDELNILLLLLNSEDEDLFDMCVDSLRGFISLENKDLIISNMPIVDKINKRLPNADVPTKKVLQDFLNKLDLLDNKNG